MEPGNHQFMECDTCRAKPGSPQLCNGCLHNRDAIQSLRDAIEYQIGYPIGKNPDPAYNIPIIQFGMKTRNEIELENYEAYITYKKPE